MPPLILICTVGGSHEPILTAIRQTAPDFVCFICSEPDPASGKPGSAVQISGKGNIIKRTPADEKPTLPNIPTQANLPADSYELIQVPADDLGHAFARIRDALVALAQRFPQGRFLADYTGGTKTMTAALVTAALESDAVELQLVTGSRADLIKVRSGMESATPAHVENIRLERAIVPYIGAWQRFAYGEAAKGLNGLPSPRDPRLAARLRLLRDLSRAFDAWDRFDHVTALTLLTVYESRIGQTTPQLLTAIKLLTTDSPKQEPMRLFDLWRNAQRRAEQGRYDDAVARLYRLLEWTAQWLLRSQCGIDTGNILPEQVPNSMNLSADWKGQLVAGLFTAWDLVERLTEGEAAGFIREHRDRLRDYIRMRNQSIFGHGFTPIHAAGWETFSGWIEQALIPMLQAEAARAGLRFLLPQLPTSYPPN